ncbi:MBL fold metallo-hydrolase [Nocardioides limicola]|uniref:MBL fold metallo-hydrolase n=1 Tax=Nocardioides limicola TaxID=2803368 RepID=UPI00193B1783|nr:MBL fold metallo-hydrolase [Nocardioides sp. DJM-14]
MRITKFGHACVRVEYDGQALAIDPGAWTQPDAVDGVAAVLITHEHPDHYHPDRLRRAEAPIFTIDAVAARIAADAPDLTERVTVVDPGDELDLGLHVQVVGEKHAEIHPDLPHFDNSGYLITAGGTRLFHPGDALTVPDGQVDVLCLPVSAPWLKASEVVDYARAANPGRALAIHDLVYSEAGLGIVDGHLARLVPDLDYARIADGSDLL